MTVPSGDTPPLDQLADEDDQLGWNREEHGTFAENATPDDTVRTEPAGAYLADPEAPEADD